jgi:hypothetical protein
MGFQPLSVLDVDLLAQFCKTALENVPNLAVRMHKIPSSTVKYFSVSDTETPELSNKIFASTFVSISEFVKL